MKPNDNVNKAIKNLAAAFCKIGQGEQHEKLYTDALESLARMVRSEVLMEITTDMNHARIATVYGPTK